MQATVNNQLLEILRTRGITTLHQAGFSIAVDSVFEPPCSIKWMDIQYSLDLGAFSYAVSGYFFATKIGRYVSIGEQAQVGRHAHPMSWLSSSPLFYMPTKDVLGADYAQSVELEPSTDFLRHSLPVELKITEIGHDVWVGHGAFIMPGVKIGDGAVVAAKAVVTRDVPPYAVVAGVPARVVKQRFTDGIIEQMLQLRWWQYAYWDLKGITIDDPLRFIGEISERAENGSITEYKPEKVSLSHLMREFASQQAETD